ncbi:Fc.00g017360.m01.CDS01 [Cosmosporella sp. VM-42]
MDDLLYRPQQSESPMNSLVSPPRNGLNSRLPAPQVSSHDPRSNLPRRFTTDSGRVPTLSSLASPPRGPDPSQDFALQKHQLIEKKKAEYERIREQRQRFEMEMRVLEQKQRQEALELAQMEEEIGRFNGHQSEPTTPPEYRDNSGFPSMFSRPNRYSTSSLTSPAGFLNRPARSGSQLASPQSGIMHNRFGFEDQIPMQMPSRSVPTTRRNSDDEKEEAVRQDPTSHRSTNATNRYSMPVTRSRQYDNGLDQTNTTRFLFGDDEPSALGYGNGLDENFPTLVRRDGQMLSASSAALDLALSPSPNPETSSSRGWSRVVNRHRPQQSMSSINGGSNQANDIIGLNSRPTSLRHSLDLKYISENMTETGSAIMSPQGSQNMTTPPKLQSSFSANDVPTVKNSAGQGMVSPNANNHAQQHFHNHNASLGRIPAGAVPRGHNRELSNDNVNGNRDQAAAYQSIQSALQASAAPFGPSMTSAAPPASTMASASANNPSGNSYNGGYFQPNGYTSPQGAHPSSGYNVPMLTAGMQQMGMNGANGGAMYSTQNFTGYGGPSYNQGNPPRDSQARVIQHRRQLDNESMARYQNMPLESFKTQIYDLCKDQHGCRYLQKKLEERIPEQVHTIWEETNEHVIELMTDPFGNYLCQKLLEYCNDDERTILIQNASQDMVRIALNQHGTRALQKMIEYVSLPQQILLIIEALRFRVVELIQDLNGNHVIQKCLNKLESKDAQFIFDAVGNNCVEVGTHRHGCCVLQRCIDHASGEQKLWLIQRITEHARILVQDPFGNYVVQYIIDLNEPTFTEPVVSMFQGCISQLSRHKFSSNVIEKCLRCSQAPSKDMIVEEMLAPQEIERLLRDSFANYVIQTALEFATPHQKHRLVEAIRPILPSIRTTPYGRRIQAKVAAYDSRGSATSSGQVTPADNTQGQIPLRSSHSRGLSGQGPMLQSNGLGNGGMSNNMRQNISYPSSSVLTVPPPPPGGPVQQPHFTRRTSGNYTPPRLHANGHSNGSFNGNPNGNPNGNLGDNGEGHWV